MCASEHNKNLKAKKDADDTIRNEDMKDDEKYYTFAMRDARSSESRVLGAMAIGLQVGNGKGGTDCIVNLEDKYWTAAINKPTNAQLYNELDRRKTIGIHDVKYTKKTHRSELINALVSTGANMTASPFLKEKISALLLVASSNKRKKPSTSSPGGEIASPANTVSSNYVDPSPDEYLTPDDTSFITHDDFSAAIQEEMSIIDGTTKINYSKQPNMASMVATAFAHWSESDYLGMPGNKTDAKHAMTKYINEHRREPAIEGGRYGLDLHQFAFTFKSKWKPAKLPVKNLRYANSYIRIASTILHPETRELSSKLLSGKKNIDDHDLGNDTVEAGWNHLASKYNDPDFEVPTPFKDDPSANSEAAIEVPHWEHYDPNCDIGNTIPLLVDGKAMRRMYTEVIARPYRTLVEKWTHTETGGGGNNITLSHRFANGQPWLTYIFLLDKEHSGGETGGLFLYDRSGVVPAEYRIEEGAGENAGDDAVDRMLSGGSTGRSPKRMKDLETALTKSLETCFAMAEERGLFAGDAKARTVNDIVEDIKITKKQMADLREMETDSLLSADSDEEDSDGDGDGMSAYKLAIASLKKRLKELKSELKNHSK